jgi:hypothetical protein
MSWKGLGFPEAALTSERVSVEEGIVEEELRRAEEAALLYGALVEMELSVQALLLKFHVRTRPCFSTSDRYRLARSALDTGKSGSLASLSPNFCDATTGRSSTAMIDLSRTWPPSKDLLALRGRSNTLKEGSGGLGISSRAGPEDFRR